MTGTVIRLIDAANGQPAPDLREWLHSWADSPAFDPEAVRSLVLVIESSEGQVDCLPQGRGPMDGFRLIGLLLTLVHRLQHGKGLWR